MIALSCKEIKKSFGVEIILENITFHINEKEKAALVGVNGAGKSTLFKIIIGELSYDEGEIIKAKDRTLGYLSQHTIIDSDSSIYEEILTVYSPLLKMEQEIREIELTMSKEKDELRLQQLMEEYSKLSDAFSSQEGYSYKSLLRGALIGLGFKEEEFQRPISTLSGGQKTRVALAKLLLQKPDILLLDEPTNHLDIRSVEWLEGFLRDYPGTVLIISHDRYFLDRFVTKVIEIENKKCEIYNGNYSFYAKYKQINREIQMKQYLEQQKEISRQEDLIRRYANSGSEARIRMAQSRMKQLDKIERIEKPENLPQKMRFQIDPIITSGNEVLRVNSISKGFKEKLLFKNVDFQIQKEEKIALIGPNGIGKTTLFKIILKELTPITGSITYGTNVYPGYYDQEQSNLDMEETILNEIWNAYPKLEHQQIRKILAMFLFTGEDVNKKISSLSGGERGRISLAKLMLSKANFLLLDEPTNHLDLASKEVLENVISGYTGTVLFISHDRYFINKVATKVIELSPDGVKQYLGNYDYYLEKKKSQQSQLEEMASENTKNTFPISSAKEEWLKRKEEAAKEKKRLQELSKIEDEIHQVETVLADIEQLMCLEENYSNPEKSQELHSKSTALKNNLEKLYALWEELSS